LKNPACTKQVDPQLKVLGGMGSSIKAAETSLRELRKPHDPLKDATISLFWVSTATKASTSSASVLDQMLAAARNFDTGNLRNVENDGSASRLRK
jgi:hypothetical protein